MSELKRRLEQLLNNAEAPKWEPTPEQREFIALAKENSKEWGRIWNWYLDKFVLSMLKERSREGARAALLQLPVEDQLRKIILVRQLMLLLTS